MKNYDILGLGPPVELKNSLDIEVGISIRCDFLIGLHDLLNLKTISLKQMCRKAGRVCTEI